MVVVIGLPIHWVASLLRNPASQNVEPKSTPPVDFNAFFVAHKTCQIKYQKWYQYMYDFEVVRTCFLNPPKRAAKPRSGRSLSLG